MTSAGEPLVTRRELDLMKAAADVEHAKLWQKIESIDDHGSRGVSVLQVQVTDITKSIARLESEMDQGFKSHQQLHEREADNLAAGRRWRAGLTVTAVLAVAGMFVTILSLLLQSHSH